MNLSVYESGQGGSVRRKWSISRFCFVSFNPHLFKLPDRLLQGSRKKLIKLNSNKKVQKSCWAILEILWVCFCQVNLISSTLGLNRLTKQTKPELWKNIIISLPGLIRAENVLRGTVLHFSDNLWGITLFLSKDYWEPLFRKSFSTW